MSCLSNGEMHSMDVTRETSSFMESHPSSETDDSHALQVCNPDFSHHPSLNFETPVSLKQRRKRTSPRDHSILEAAYQRNSKPDKEERAELVQQVALGEKEVQIWFQNRRQNDRRKSKPLLPHELIPHFRNGVPNEVARRLASPEDGQSRASLSDEGHSTSSLLELTRPISHASSIQNLLNPSPISQEELSTEATASAKKGLTLTPPSSFESSCASVPRLESLTEDPNVAQQNSSTSDSHSPARKRSHEEMAGMVRSQAQSIETERDTHKLHRTSSFVRLAVDADGSFKIRTGDEPTPSPPKQRTAPPSQITNAAPVPRGPGLTRSQSVIEDGLNFKDINPPIKRAPGRSRDARTWEFYCDRGAREALASQAEEQEHGSAVNAINIMRSGNQPKTSTLSPNVSKKNKEAQASKKRPKAAFSRTQSSMARLQGITHNTQDTKSCGQLHVRSNSGGDSDKENWMPGTRNSHNGMRRMHPSAPRDAVLQEHERRPVSRSATSSGDEQRSDKSTLNTAEPKSDDLDCIQGLLSLSQGAWR